MSQNEAVAALLSDMATLLELLGENQFKAIAHSRASRVVESLDKPVETLDKAALVAIDGIGDKIAGKIVEFCTTGRMKEHEELAAQVPAGLRQILELPGLGPKTVRAMWQTLNITDLAGLRKAIDDGSLLKLPRMGEKAVEKIKGAIALGEEATRRTPIGLAMPLAERLRGELLVLAKKHTAFKITRVEIAGSLRRGRDTIADLDFLVCTAGAFDSSSKTVHPILEEFTKLPEVRQIIVAGATKASVRCAINIHTARWKGGADQQPAEPTIQVDVRLVPEGSFGAAWMYFTGSKDHNVVLRQRALAQGMTLNEYGLFKEDKTTDVPPQHRGAKPVAAATEEDVFKKLGLAWVPPESRESVGEVSLAEKDSLPELIELADIKSELHAHTTASDGKMSMRELVMEAHRRGFHSIAVTDHSKSSAVANGLSIERLKDQIKQVKQLNKQLADEGIDIKVLSGSEVDILADGTLDYDDDLLAELDVVVASPHVALSQDPKTATERLLKAIEHPMVHILGHPTGRLINRRNGLAPDMPTLIAAAKAHDTALEINAHWMRLDLRDTHVRMAVAGGCTIAIDCDDHDITDFDNLRYGVLTARRGGLTATSCVNAWDRKKLLAWLKR